MSSFKIVPLGKDLMEEGLAVLREFFVDENVCKCINLLTESNPIETECGHKSTDATLELELFNEDAALKDNVSLAAVDSETNEVLGIAINKIQVKLAPGEEGYFENFIKERIKTASALAIFEFMIKMDSRLDLFEHFAADCYLELMTLGVKASARGRGVARALIQATIKLAEEHTGPHKIAFVSAIFTSAASQKAGASAGMESILEVPYSEFDHNGRKFSDVLGPNQPSCNLSVKKFQ